MAGYGGGFFTSKDRGKPGEHMEKIPSFKSGKDEFTVEILCFFFIDGWIGRTKGDQIENIDKTKKETHATYNQHGSDHFEDETYMVCVSLVSVSNNP